jgi:hypothetical protein
MSVQLPVLSTAQQQALLAAIQTNAMAPVSFIINRTMTNGNFPNSGGGGRYVTFTYQPPTSMGIIAIGINLFQVTAGTLYNLITQVSYASTLNIADASSLTIPTDNGNIIYTGNFQNVNSNDYASFSPGDYYLQANNLLYVHFWVETAGIGSGNTFVGSVTLHTAPTGSKT